MAADHLREASMDFTQIKVKTHNRVGLIQLNRPKALNALNRQVMQEVGMALKDFDSDPKIGAMVITGDQRAFAAGADIKEMAEATSVEMLSNDTIGLWDQISQIAKPIIAAVSGWCLGGGNELAMACDMVVASESAKFGQPEINIGVIPGAGGTQRLTRAVGKALAMEMVLNDRYLSAAEALHYGLVNKIVPDELYLEEALTFAAEIAALGHH
jgi:enoyl-CoA hydratase